MGPGPNSTICRLPHVSIYRLMDHSCSCSAAPSLPGAFLLSSSSINSPPPPPLPARQASPAKMKLLGWMHRKLRSNNDVFKEFNTGGGGPCNCITGLASPDHDTFLTSATEYFADADAFATDHPSPPVSATDLFTLGGSGLLTIGTLGFAAVAIPGDDNEDGYDVDVDSSDDGTVVEEDDGTVTPTFTFPPPPEPSAVAERAIGVVEAIAEKDDDTTTEDDLMLVSAELEKVLGGTGAGDVPSARVSFAMGVDCPLQGFLFGSPVSSDVESRPEHRDNGGRRTSLGELFMRTRFAEEKVALVAVAESEDGGDRAAGGESEGGKAGKGGGGGHKTVKKRKVKDAKGAGGDGVPAIPTTKSKFQKILQIFHRKVYPESTILTRNLTKKNRKRGAPDNGAAGGDADEPAASPKLRFRKDQRMLGLGCCTNRAFGASPDDDGELNGDKSGHWIKTDADYLVLEL